jgi:hypothetical protein
MEKNIGYALLITGVLLVLYVLVSSTRKMRKAQREHDLLRQKIADKQRDVEESIKRGTRIADKVIPLGDPRHPASTRPPLRPVEEREADMRRQMKRDADLVLHPDLRGLERKMGKRKEFAAPYGRTPAPAPRAAEQRRDDSNDSSDYLTNPANPLYQTVYQTHYDSSPAPSCDSSSSYSSSDSGSSSCSSDSGSSSSSCGCD